MTESEKEMVAHWDAVSKAVLATASQYDLTPMYVILEFCCENDYPESVN